MGDGSREEDIIYDLRAYGLACDKVRNVQRALEDMPEPDRSQAADMLQHLVHYVFTHIRAYRSPDSILNTLPNRKVLPLVRDALCGVVEACQAIYERETDPEKIFHSGSNTDYETDKKALDDFLTCFSPRRPED